MTGDLAIARALLDALDRGDPEALAACMHDDAAWHNTRAFPGAREVTGPDAIAAFWGELVESFDHESGRTEIEDAAAGGDRVVLAVRSRGSGAASGVPVDVRWALAVRFRDGLVERVDVSGDYRTALERARLDE